MRMKRVNGVDIEMSAQEEADFLASLPGPVVPAEVTMRQARLALLAIGKLADVSTLIAALPEPQKSAAAVEWEYSSTVQRSNPFVQSLGPALGVDLDALFISAAAL